MVEYPIDVISSWVEGDELVEIIIEHKPGIDETKERRSPKPADPEPAPEQPTNSEILAKLLELETKLDAVKTSTTTIAADVVAVKEASVSAGTVEKAA